MEELKNALNLAFEEFLKDKEEGYKLEEGCGFVTVFNNATLYVSLENGEVRTEFLKSKPYEVNLTLQIFEDAEREETEISKEKLLNLDYLEKLELIRAKKYLDVFLNDEDWRVRVAVAKQGYGLEQLIDDEHWQVREVVAYKGYGLKQLVDDDDEDVRRAVAEQGYGLEQLLYDEIQYVREMAEQKAIEILREHTEQYYK